MASTSTAKPVRNAKKREKIKGSINLNIEEIQLIKKEFNEKVHEHFLSTKNGEEFSIMSNLKSSKSVDSMIQKIKKEEENSRLDNNYNNIYHDKYKIVQSKDGKERLFFKDEDFKFKMILPWEDIFDVYWETHVKYGHTEAMSLKNILRRDYIVNDFAIQCLSEICYTCSGPKKPYYCCSLDLITMAGTDFAFSHLMVCQDMYTGFIHLRPLCADNKVSEICMELFRIFMDFGPPKQVVISDEVFITALEQIEHITTYAPISIEIIKVNMDYPKLNQLRKKIRAWMVANNFENWCLACYGVQLHLNKENRHGKKSPYDSVFKKITTCVVEDLTEVELVSSEISIPSDVELVDKAVSTRSPIDFNAMRFLTGTRQANPDSHSTDEVQEIPCTSEVPSVKGTSTAIETEFKAGSASPDSHSSDEVQEISFTSEIPSVERTSTAMETEFNVGSASLDSHSSDEVQEVSCSPEVPSVERTSTAIETEFKADSASPDPHSSDDDEEVQEISCTSEHLSDEETVTTIETDFKLASEDEMFQCEDEDPLAID